MSLYLKITQLGRTHFLRSYDICVEIHNNFDEPVELLEVSCGFQTDDEGLEAFVTKPEEAMYIKPRHNELVYVKARLEFHLRASTNMYKVNVKYIRNNKEYNQPVLTSAFTTIQARRPSATSCFISYKMDADEEIAKKFKEYLETKVGFKCNIADEFMNIGKKITVDIKDNIKRSDAVILIWTKNSLNSEPIVSEIEYAKSENKFIMPIIEKNVEFPKMLNKKRFFMELESNPSYYEIAKIVAKIDARYKESGFKDTPESDMQI